MKRSKEVERTIAGRAVAAGILAFRCMGCRHFIMGSGFRGFRITRVQGQNFFWLRL